jgi:hypothetical protein
MARRTRSGWIALTLAALLAGCDEQADERASTQAAAPAAQTFRSRDTAADRRAQREAEVRRRERSMPRFEDFPARDTFTGTPAPVDLSSAEGARQFRTVLRGGASQGLSFAGRYTVVEWGCGSPCQSFAIVDARTGRVTFGPASLTVGASYRLDSELLIADPPERWLESCGADATDAVGGNASSIYYRWDGRRLVALDSLAIGSSLRW